MLEFSYHFQIQVFKFLPNNIQMADSESFTLEEYKIQREYREAKRKEYLMRFQNLKAKMGISGQRKIQESQEIPYPVSEAPMRVEKPVQASNVQEQEAERQNMRLKQELVEMEQEERKKLAAFKNQIETVKGKYIEKIKDISEKSNALKQDGEQKIKKIESQIKNAAEKNVQIENVNKQIENELSQGDALMEKYSDEINKEYKQKLSDFEKIFESSNEKIEQMEKEYNEEEFVENTLQNEELIQTIKDNAEKADEDIDKILSDYQELLEGKTEILNELTQNNEMKEREIVKMGELEGKLKNILEKLNEEKKLFLDENHKMAEELMEVKNLLMSTMGQATEE